MHPLIRAACRALVPLAVLATLMTTAGAASAKAADPPRFYFKVTFNGVTKCLDADRTDDGGPGTRVQLWDCLGTPNQQWTYAGPKKDRIQNWWVQKEVYTYAGFLTATGTTDGDPVVLENYPGGPVPKQLWWLLSDSSIRGGLHPNKCLDADISPGALVNGAKANLWFCPSRQPTLNQVWNRVPV